MRVFVAGKPLEVKTEVVRRYVNDHWKTATAYDLKTGTYDEVSEGLIKSTRVFSSRISEVECGWFVKCGLTAPWLGVEPGDCLSMADPLERDGLYDKGLDLWNHFSIGRPAGIADAKISKVLHAMRPSFFPVLDSRVRKHYKSQSSSVARQMADQRSSKHAYWSAIRLDLLASDKALAEVRSELQIDKNGLINEWAKHVSDVRLHDVLVWSN
jgi:hypothetical protein